MLTNTHYSSHLRMTLLFFATIQSAGYVFFSYYQTTANIMANTKKLFLEEKEETTEALSQFHQFLQLTETRLINSVDKREKILSILSFRTEQLISRKFPDLFGLSFSPRSDPSILYSRFGKTLPLHKPNLQKKSDAISYLGKGQFQVMKTLYNSHKKDLGTRWIQL